MASRLWAWIRLGRPHFLMGSPLFFLLGALLARSHGADWTLTEAAWGLAAVLLVHWHVHYANDGWDLQADRGNLHRTPWAGGSRVLVTGTLSPRTAHVTAGVLLALALMVGTPWVWDRGWPTILAAAVTVVGAWGYSAPPLRLQARGFGPITVGLVVAGAVPAFAYLGLGGPDPWILLAFVPFVLHSTALVAALDLPDRDGDALAGKWTWAVRWGRARTGRVAAVLLVASYVWLPVAVAAAAAAGASEAAARGAGGAGSAMVAILWSLPIAAWAVWLLWRRGDDVHAWPLMQWVLIALVTAAPGAVILRLLSA